MQAYPLKFGPIYKERIWGGDKLREVFGREMPRGKRIGESWELADLPEDKSKIVNGELTGETIESVIRKYTKEITGAEQFKLPFPLLIKFLDCGDVLSVQVHPDKETCKRMGKGDFKTECWYIIQAQPGAVIYKGLKEGTTKDRFAKAIKDGTVERLLVKVPVKVGECHFLPAGTPHAIGTGLLIAEIQTPSDTTYRVFDWNRVDDKGKPRQLHIEEAMESIHFDSSGDNLSVASVGRLVDSACFKVDKGHQARSCEMLLSAGKMKTIMIMSGFGTIAGKGNTVEFRAGDTILIPAAYGGVMRFSAETEYLTATI
ncbi:MAG: type I phosphomannose isomerase catalytic subunit [Sedimentisphaerales bacterium]|jgi:mannose-6-phosphate isomerase